MLLEVKMKGSELYFRKFQDVKMNFVMNWRYLGWGWKCAIIALAVFMFFQFVIACKYDENKMTKFTVQTIAMAAGYEAKQRGFEVSDEVQGYYEAIMMGKMDLIAAQKAEVYLRGHTHPVIANRLVEMAKMTGFSFDSYGSVIGVEGVDMPLLQAAADGFRIGLSLSEKP
jgi:hypothetical protein